MAVLENIAVGFWEVILLVSGSDNSVDEDTASNFIYPNDNGCEAGEYLINR